MGSGFSALLRCPASASCLGRHSRLADRCAKNCSLFPPQAAVAILALDRTGSHAALIVFLLCQDQIYSGMAAGAVKG
jgi:hypothetical protein